MKYGLHFRSWDGLYENSRIMEIAAQAKELGAETFEVFPPEFVIRCEKDKIRRMRKQIDDLGIEFYLTCKYPADADIASEDAYKREKGVTFMKRYIEGAAELGVSKIAGIVYSTWPHPYHADMIDKKVKYDRTMYSMDSMRDILSVAEDCGIYLEAEIVNRFEHYLINTAEEAVAYCEAVNSPMLRILFDVFHANIEEDSLGDAIRLCGKWLDHFHVSEPNRRIPYHNGRINWAEVGKALADINYQGSVTLEPILLFLGKTSYNSRMFRDLIDDTSEEKRLQMLKAGLQFIKSEFDINKKVG